MQNAMRRTKADAEKTRETILATAEQLFLRNGVAHTSLEQVARASGVTRGAIYWHFQNKSHLLNEMLNQVRPRPEKLAERLNAPTATHPLQNLRDLFVEIMAGLAGNEQKRNILTILLLRCEFTDELSDAEERHTDFINQFIALSEEQFGREQVRLRPGISARLAARLLHATLIGMLSDRLRDPALFDTQAEAPAMIDALFSGLLVDWQIAGHGASA
ncbi:transcriptional regulator, TetR family [Azotobacter beijerinckii]|uniref:Transcriptional regulator, TetR family n=2 Tax=Azotobacter beijerinckii TaxID=170623 RepID=A0A1H6WTN7_9GAMM|nr:transcriptional regulator, TetR family [Azotobacter beijerinckii]